MMEWWKNGIMQSGNDGKMVGQAEFEEWDILAYKLENGNKKLIESLQYKREKGEWDDSFVVKESNLVYGKKVALK